MKNANDVLLFNGIERVMPHTSEKSVYYKVRDLETNKVLFKSKDEKEALKALREIRKNNKRMLLSFE